VYDVKGALEPHTPEYRRFIGPRDDWPRWPEASELAGRLAHACTKPWDTARAYDIFRERFPEYPFFYLGKALTSHPRSCAQHDRAWAEEVLDTGLRWVKARMRALPDAVFPLAEYNLKTGWRKGYAKDDPYEILGDRRLPAEIQRAWEASVDLYSLRREKPPPFGRGGGGETDTALVRRVYPGFSDESYAMTLDHWYWVTR
jgi:hypothetical protein